MGSPLFKKADRVVVMRDNQVMTEPMTSGMALEWLHNNYSGSIASALRHEGYKIVPYTGQMQGVPEFSGEDKDWLREQMGIIGSEKTAEMGKFPDDDWREILHANGFTPSGAREEVWRSPYSDLKVKIDVDREIGEPYYQVITEDGSLGDKQSDSENLKSIVKPQEPEPPQLSPEEAEKKDKELLKSMGIIGRQRRERKMAGRPPQFSFAVPTKASGHVAFQLAKAGMKDFEVVHFEEEDVSIFAFKTEPDMHVAEEIVKAEFADQISAGKGMWKAWTPQEDVMALPEPEHRKQKPLVSSVERTAQLAREMGKVAGQWGDRSEDSDTVHDILDKYRHTGDEGANVSFDDPVPDEKLPALLKELDGSEDNDRYLGVVVFLVTHGSQVPSVHRQRAAMIAEAMLTDEEYLQSWQNPALRSAELEKELDILRSKSAKTAEMTDAEVKKMNAYRRKKLLAWIDELGLDLSEELKKFDEGDFWAKDEVYEAVRDMIKDERKHENWYRRTMRGPRPYNRKPKEQ